MSIWKRILSWFKRKEKAPVVTPPIVIPPEVITLPSTPPAPTKLCSVDFKLPDHECLAGMLKLDNPQDAQLLKIKEHYQLNESIYRKAALKIAQDVARPFSDDEMILLPKLLCALNYREDSDMDFNGVLHNGESLVSVNKYGTKLVPKGYGKGQNWTWAEAAHHAMMLKKSIFPSRWTLGACLAFAEKFNGLGYRSRIGDKGKVELSPYVYAFTNLHDETGKYVSDGKFSPTAPEKQRGVAAIMLAI